MALKESNTREKGFPAPHFNLLDTTKEKLTCLENLKGEKATVILFICNHCPFVLHINKKLVEVAHAYQVKGIGFIAISSNDALNYPQDGPDKMKTRAEAFKYPFPYLYDETQEVAKAYDAACTPDIYVFDKDLALAYHGQFDDSRPGNDIPITGNHLTQALDNILVNKPIAFQKPSIGCNIKWK